MKLSSTGFELLQSSQVTVSLFSRRRKPFAQYPQIIEALNELPEGKVFDGEIVAQTVKGDLVYWILRRCNLSLLECAIDRED